MRSVAVLTHLVTDTAWGLWDRLDAKKVHDDEWWDESNTHIGRRRLYDEPIKLSCGQTVTQVNIPGVFSRGGFGGGLPRCKRCCKATGLPEGNGSPKNDDECRRILGMDPS